MTAGRTQFQCTWRQRIKISQCKDILQIDKKEIAHPTWNRLPIHEDNMNSKTNGKPN